jgi:hypothetical protein
LSEVYSHGLEIAIARQGGFENIAFRKQRRTKAGIEFEIEMEGEGRDLSRYGTIASRRFSGVRGPVRLAHHFLVDTPDTGGIRADFSVKDERFSISVVEGGKFTEVVRFVRNEGRKIDIQKLAEHPLVSDISEVLNLYSQRLFDSGTEEQDLLVNALPLRNFIRPFTAAVSRFAVYQLSPVALRQPGIPTPNPTLSTAGQNLPALVDWLQHKHTREWATVMAGMREVLGGLSDIGVQYLHTRALGLVFSEVGTGRPWNVEEVSDGTVQSLALFVAATDPRNSLLVVEEPENSVHPWIIRALVKRFREISRLKNVIITTHSPVVIDLLEPEEAWILSRVDGETQLRRLTDLDPTVAAQWRDGKFKLSHFLDAGFVPQAVPGGAL